MEARWNKHSQSLLYMSLGHSRAQGILESGVPSPKYLSSVKPMKPLLRDAEKIKSRVSKGQE